MKIAICFSGEMRDMEKCVSYWKPIIERYGMDVYGSFWDSPSLHLFSELNPKRVEIEPLSSFLPYMDLFREEIRVPVYPEVNFGLTLDDASHTYACRWLSMWYRVWRAHMLTVGEEYDIIIRTRTDCYFDRLFGEIGLEKREGLCLPWGWVHNSAWQNCGGPVDMFAYGGRREMDIYSSLFLYLSRYLQSHYLFPAENLLKVHLAHFPLTLHYIPTHINLFRRSEDTFNWAYGVMDWAEGKSDFALDIDPTFSFFRKRN
jgi:hypothetical protein